MMIPTIRLMVTAICTRSVSQSLIPQGSDGVVLHDGGVSLSTASPVIRATTGNVPEEEEEEEW